MSKETRERLEQMLRAATEGLRRGEEIYASPKLEAFRGMKRYAELKLAELDKGPSLDDLIKGFSELTDDQGVNSFTVATWFIPGSGFLAALLRVNGGDIGIVATTWNYHPTTEAAVKALWEETTEIRARGFDG